ncbi:putative disease resistance protein At3g14460 [Eucalyptus grandis]|uniref:putative disease resistance protein At3g14460 n=1 Tax=Eucalyptus grandis TaxID=71139 RepID=UPI00192E8B5E|nr:putative disease resistance protein At3g14460 [Eucalyptus grandis]XP_039163327.1 putative disease resistance protein At3g14460 [Eucalyptus grandis]XP_039163328.1 putative disease resistance protein At3g14460 [Eucalyptus grandis]XP_039163329.1 putative disease resistance protein At3g14460 [Eucalyptus grandis]XP_039163330.1 putative disease resistance protein At3g14460 [Eucalyptus grandis]XP_039163331.1 putative disease resistance protein At3g14460 [Eucalyptus grandis]XP_039163332.1 putative
MKGLRSFISLDKSFIYYNVSQKVLCDLLLALKYLRVLSLSHYSINEIPYCIGELMHLRYLNLSYTGIKMLPKSIVALYNLEALMLGGCHNLLEFPKGMEKLINLRFLDISNTTSLKVTPLYIGKLVGLEMMSKFVVGTGNGSRLEELKDLEILRGELCISDLHMVREAKDARDANLCVKKGICRLTMRWSTNFENSRNEELEREVLNFLCPHQNLENLTIFCYGGLKFPSWLGSPSHDKLVHLHLHGCQKVKTLPSLGLLPSLKELYIKDLNAICTVGSEFYGSNSPFPSLITLKIEGMPLWKDWSHCVGIEEVIFPHLEHLVISHCPMLIGRLPSQLSSLIKLEIYSCPHMDASLTITSLPSLNELEFKGCNEGVLQSLVSSASLTTLTIDDVIELACLNHGLTSSLIKLEKLKIVGCTKLRYLWQDGDAIRNLNCLKSLVVCRCPEFIHFVAEEGDIELPGSLETIELQECIKLEKLPSKVDVVELACLNHGFTSSLIKLEKLKIVGCTKLRYLWQDGDAIRNLNCLKSLVVRSCPEFIHFVAEGDIELPGSLETIELQECIKLEKLPSKMHTLSSLRDLTVRICPKLVSFPETGIPTSIISLNIENCEMLQSLPRGLSAHLDEPSSSSSNTRRDIISFLQDLRISGCNSLPSSPFSEVIFLPTTLKRLNIHDCRGVESLAEINLDPFQSLQEIEIVRCENLRSLPQGLHTLSQLSSLGLAACPALEVECFPPLPPGISIFSLRSCPKIKSLPNQLYRLACLRYLLIWDCERFTRFPDGGLPPQLERLELIGCENMKQPVREWLTPLTSLERLDIDGRVGGVGEEEDLVLPLPSSLLYLNILRMGKVERLSSSLPPSLRSLWISYCPKLRELPQDGLPPSLEDLWIFNCPILQKRCKKGTGYYWPLLREIPDIRGV